ncbi:hypothetical protein NMY22_g9685 [Coprinellus aureogranulatus]|nr:hypothetical protein NMY22_g9685 [Coprinellus aureogranulatus]
MSESSATHSCPVLEGPDNYQIWKIRIEAKLQTEKVYGVIDGTDPRPEPSVSITTQTPSPGGTVEATPSGSNQSIPPDPKKILEWSIRDAKARGIIITYVNDEIALEIAALEDKSAKAAHNAIVAKYETTNAGSTAFASFLELLELKWDGASSYATHTGRFLAISSKLASLKYPLPELFKSYLFLRSLPNTPTWQVFSTAFINSIAKPEEIKLTDVMNRAASQLSNSTNLANQPASSQPQIAYQASKKCLYHNTGGHSTDECWTAKKLIEQAKEKDGGKKEKPPRSRGRKKKENAKAAEAQDGNGAGDTGDGSDSDEYANHVFLSSKMIKHLEAYVVARGPSETRNQVFFDSAASSTMTPNSHWLLPGSIRPLDKPIAVHLGDDSIVEGTAKGTMRVRLRPKIAAHTLVSIPALATTGYNVLFTAKGAYATAAGRSMAKPVLQATLDRGMYRLNGHIDENDISQALITHATSTPQGKAIDIVTLHRRMGHASESRLRKMVRDGKLQGISSITGKLGVCEACALGKMKKLPFRPKSRRETTAPFELIHTDVGGPITPKSPSGFRYWIVFIDDYTRYPFIFFLRNKDEAKDVIHTFYTDVRAYFRTHIGKFRMGEGFYTSIRSDNGGEYIGAEVEAFLKSHGIFHEKTAPYTPEQNGLAERMNQSLRNSATAMLIDSGLPKTYWTEAMTMAAHIIARTPAAGIGGDIPYERMFKRKVDPTTLRPFGCVAYALIPKDLRKGKFDSNARKCILLGYQSEQRAYRLLDLATKKVISSRHVAFDEDRRGSVEGLSNSDEPDDADWGELFWQQRPASKLGAQMEASPPHVATPPDDEDIPGYASDSVGAGLDENAEAPHNPPQVQTNDPEPQPPANAPPAPAPRRRRANPPPPRDHPQRERRQPEDVYRQAVDKEQTRLNERRARADAERQRRLQDPVGADSDDGADGGNGNGMTDEEQGQPIDPNENEQAQPEMAHKGEQKAPAGDPNDNLPLTLREAMARPEDGHLWRGAKDDELNSLKKNQVYEVVPIPQGVKPITSKAVLRIKLDANGNIVKYKVRFVARGFTQVKGKDYQDTFAPVANLESIRIILALAAQFDLELDQMDVKTAYLNGILDEELYLMPPDGVSIKPGHCWRLKRSLYGLKQSGRTWNKTLDSSLLGMGFVRLDAETCLYVYREGKQICFVVIYVDDLLLAATTRPFMDLVKQKLRARFEMEDLGPATYILGMAITRDRKNRTISISQRRYIESVLERTGMSDCKPAWTPIPTSAKLTAEDPNDNTILHYITIEGREVSFKSVIGSLMYAMLATRPDLAFAVGLLGRFAAAPKQVHWTLAKRCLRYLQATKNMELRFDGSAKTKDMTFFGYVDAAWSDDVDTSRSTGGYVFITSNGALGWSSKRQPIVALSSTEAEYISMCFAGQHLAWLRTFFEDIGHPQQGPTTLYNDNQGAITLSKDPQYRARTKHIQRKYHFVRDDLVRKGLAKVTYLPTGEMVADIMTKPLPHDLHWKFVKGMGLHMDSSGSVRNQVH